MPPAFRTPTSQAGSCPRRLRASTTGSRAEEYAAALGGRVGAIASIAELGSGPALPAARMYAVRQEISPMPLEAGEHEVMAEVDVTFQLEQG